MKSGSLRAGHFTNDIAINVSKSVMSSQTLYLHRSSGLHALHPMTKLTLTCFFLIAAATLPNLWLVLGVYVFCLIPIAAWGRVLKTFLKSSLTLIWPFALSLFLIQGFFSPGENILLTLGPLTLKSEGVWLAARFTTRILVWLGAATLLMLVTRPDRLMLALVERGLPRNIAYIILTSLQIIPRFQGKAQLILDAQHARGLDTEGTLVHRTRMLVPLIAPLILSSLLDLDERAIALEARAFNRSGPKTSLISLEDTRFQGIARWSLLGLIFVLICARLVGVLMR
jgi:energy-coupling factor transport system permease protein